MLLSVDPESVLDKLSCKAAPLESGKRYKGLKKGRMWDRCQSLLNHVYFDALLVTPAPYFGKYDCNSCRKSYLFDSACFFSAEFSEISKQTGPRAALS